MTSQNPKSSSKLKERMIIKHVGTNMTSRNLFKMMMGSGYRNIMELIKIPSRGGGLKPCKEISLKHPIYKEKCENNKKFYHLSTVNP